MAKVYSIASQKGGTGKTSTSISLAAGLAREGKKVLLIDIDPQANASKVLLPDYQNTVDKDNSLWRTIIERQPLPIHHTSIPSLDIVPGHILLSDTDVVLTTAFDRREARLKSQLDQIKDEYDFVFIDCPPALSWLTINAFSASNEILIIISPGYFELDSTVQIGKTITKVQEEFNETLKLRGFLFTMSEPTVSSKVSLKLLRQTYTDQVLNTIIPKNTELRAATMAKKDIFGYSPRCKAAEAYKALIAEVFA